MDVLLRANRDGGGVSTQRDWPRDEDVPEDPLAGQSQEWYDEQFMSHPVTGASGRLEYLRSQLLDSIAMDSLPDPEPVIDGMLYLNSLAWLHGKPASGKSFVALDWAACVSTGLPWQDHEVREGPVLYVIGEGSSGMARRKRAWEQHAQQRMQVIFLPVPVQIANGDLEALTEICRELAPVMIVLDTQARVSVGLDENSARDMGTLIEAAEKLRASCGACVLFVHHEPRGGENMRGSTALEGAAMTEVRAVKDGVSITLQNPKQKEAAEFDPIELMLRPEGESAVITARGRESFDLPDASRRILICLRESFGESIAASRADIMEETRLSKATCNRALKVLVDGNYLLNVGTAKRPAYQLRCDHHE